MIAYFLQVLHSMEYITIHCMCILLSGINRRCGILGQVWYLIVSTPDFCTLTLQSLQSFLPKYFVRLLAESKFAFGSFIDIKLAG